MRTKLRRYALYFFTNLMLASSFIDSALGNASKLGKGGSLMRQGRKSSLVCTAVGLGMLLFLAGCGGGDDENIVIESEQNVTSTLGCALRVRVHNPTGDLVSVQLAYNAFDSARTGIGFTAVGGILPANSTQTLESPLARLWGRLHQQLCTHCVLCPR